MTQGLQLATELRERRPAVEAAQHFLARAQAHQPKRPMWPRTWTSLARACAQDAAIAAGTATGWRRWDCAQGHSPRASQHCLPKMLLAGY